MDQNAKEVCLACQKKTQIHYSKNDGFFKPRLAGINHLEVGYSKMISNPLTIMAEFCYLMYEKLRNFYSKLKKFLFPRHPKIYSGKLDSYITGKVTHSSRREVGIPIHNMRIEFWGRTRFNFQFRKFGETHTHKDGTFNLPYTLRQARSWRIRSLKLELYEPFEVKYKNNKPYFNYRIYETVAIKKGNLIGLGFSVNTIALPLWEYRIDTKIPRTYFPIDPKYAPEVYEKGREDALVQQIMPIELTKQKHLIQIKIEPGVLTLAQIQNDYPENLTVCIEKKLPGYTRSDTYFAERFINGMNKGSLMPEPGNPDILHAKLFGICNYDHNLEYAFPNVDIVFKKTGEALPTLESITFTGPLNAINKDPWQTHTYTPQSGEDWLAAKRLARVCGAVVGEVEEHFSGTHVNTEQYGIAAFRNFRKNPIGCLLFPHLKEVSLINAAADKTIIGGYLPSATALTEKGLIQRIYDTLGTQNWKGWKPMEIINESHTYAKAENLFWNLTSQFVDYYFVEYEEVIKKHWYEVYLFSNDLVAHSVPVFFSETDLTTLDKREKALIEERLAYAQFQFNFNPAYCTEIIDGERKTITPITKTEIFEKEEDFFNLKQACLYAIMMATFSHTWINEHQYDDLGEILYSCGGLRFGEKDRGVMGPESDLSIAQDLTRATTMLWFTNLLSRTEYGFITANEEKDIHPFFVDILLQHKAEFASLGVDIEAIESRTNI